MIDESPRLAGLDWLRDRARNATPCDICGSIEPARISADGCSNCTTYPTCSVCGRWTGGVGPLAHEEIDHD